MAEDSGAASACERVVSELTFSDRVYSTANPGLVYINVAMTSVETSAFDPIRYCQEFLSSYVASTRVGAVQDL